MPLVPMSLARLPQETVRLGLNWRRSFIEVVWCWLQIAVVIDFVGWYGRWWVYPFAIVLISSRQYALAVLLHEAQHRSLFPNRAVNDFIAHWSFAAPLMADFETSRKMHMAHHRYLGNRLLDPDWPIYTGRSWLRTALYAPPPRSWIVIAAMQGVIAGILGALIGWWAYAVLWLLPLVGAGLLDRLRIRAEHDARGRVWSHRSNPLERFFLSPFHMDHHAEHHISPHIPHYRLPAKRRELVGVMPPVEWLRGNYL